MADWVHVAPAADCPPGQLLGAFVSGRKIALANIDGAYYAIEDECTHQEFPLSDGELDGSDVVCMYHGARFDVCTGRAKALPAIRPVRTFPVEIRDGDVYVDIG